MNISKNSKKLMMFFKNKNHINKIKQTKRTDEIISDLYYDILEAYKHLLSLKQTGNYYNVKTKRITNAKEITKPQIFSEYNFPELIVMNINKFSVYEIIYTFSLFGRKVKVNFILEEEESKINIVTFNGYIDNIIMWLHILNKYSSKQCANTLIIYLYLTSLEKALPHSNSLILNEIHVNTAFTTTCPKDSEIVVFRKEEWFKVLIHETFHNFGLDFSNMNNETVTKCILDIFKVKSEVKLYESYTEFWAEIMNALFFSFLNSKDKYNIEEFLSNSEFFINFERTYSFFQLVKTLNFMGLTYKDLYSKTQYSKNLRENLYKEKTNILAYYVIKTILMNNYQTFLYWCKTNNSNILQFKKTPFGQQEFCNYIEKNYKTSGFLNGIDKTEEFLNKLQKNSGKNTEKNNSDYILSNLRMSICELG
jgi:hypothetical protein